MSDDFLARHKNPYIRMFQKLSESKSIVHFPEISVTNQLTSEFSTAFDRIWLLKTTPRRALADVEERVEEAWERERARQARARETEPSGWLRSAPFVLLAGIFAVVAFLGRREHKKMRAVTPRSSRANASLVKGLLFLSPWIGGLLVFVLYPVTSSVVYSFCDYSVLTEPRFVGLANYQDLFQDQVFWVALKNTAIYALFALPLGLFVAFSFALLLSSNVKAVGIYRTLIFLPSLTPLVASAMVWIWIFNTQYGVLNHALSFLTFGLVHHVAWLKDARFAMPSLIMMSFWGVGHTVVLMLAAMQEVPTSVYEAADIDGASFWQKVRRITLPMISPVLYFNTILGIIGVLQVFAIPYVMTGGGPARSTYFYAMYLYDNAFSFLRMGYACAMAWILFSHHPRSYRARRAGGKNPRPFYRMTTAITPFTGVFRQHRWAIGVVHALLVMGALVFVFPMLWMVSTSLKPIDEVMKLPPSWIPETVKWQNYVDMLDYIPFGRFALNTLIVCVLATVGTVTSSALVAYSFTRLEWPGQKAFFALTLATMMIPFPVLMVPLYSVFKWLGWIGSLKPLWFPSFFGGAFNIFLLRQFFSRIPKTLGEAMALDGASELAILWKVYVPPANPPLQWWRFSSSSTRGTISWAPFSISPTQARSRCRSGSNRFTGK